MKKIIATVLGAQIITLFFLFFYNTFPEAKWWATSIFLLGLWAFVKGIS
jgi:hypothetical protein